jgi:hypothetical protein
VNDTHWSLAKLKLTFGAPDPWRIRFLRFRLALGFPNGPNDSFLALGNLPKDRRKVNGLIREFFEFRNLETVEDPETVTFKQRESAPIVKRYHLCTDPRDPLLGQKSQKRFQGFSKGRDALCRRQKIDVEMSDPPRSRRNFSPGISKDPTKIALRFRLISVVANQGFCSEENALGRTEELMAQRIPATQDKSRYGTVDRNNKGRIRFTSQIIVCKEISEKVSIFKDWIDRSAEKAGVTANAAYCITIDWSIAANHEWFDIQRKYSTGISLNFDVSKK